MTHKQYILNKLEDARPLDDLARVRQAFFGMSSWQLMKPHGDSGQTRLEYIMQLEDQQRRHNEAVEWLKRVPEKKGRKNGKA